MKWAKILLLFLFIQSKLIAQSNIFALKSHEIELIQILLADSLHEANFNISSKTFNFGLDESLFGHFSILKNKKEILLQPIGTGRLYKVEQNSQGIYLKRIDKTVHSGTNFSAKNFFIHDTLYQFGGLGFWQIRGIMTQFSNETKQWELIKTNKAVTSYFVDNNDAVLHVENGLNPVLYVSNSYYLKYFPQQYEIESIDSVFSYQFNKHEWTTLGKLNPLLKKLLSDRKSREFEINFNEFYITQNRLDFYWMNFKNNQFGNVKSDFTTKLRYKWLSFYNEDNKAKNQVSFQFLMGDKIYFIKHIENEKLLFTTEVFNKNCIDYSIVNPIYSNTNNPFKKFFTFIIKYKEFSIVLVLFLLSLLLIRRFLRYKGKLPLEVVTILNNNFFTALTIVEKELIEELFNHHLKGEEVSTKLINKIIGVQQKDTLTQNKSRSDYFIRINQKFKMATHYSEPLIVKKRDQMDKRQYNYSLNSNYITDIEKLFK